MKTMSNTYDLSLFKQLASIHSPSGYEKKIRKYIKQWVTKNEPSADIVQMNGNLYITKGESDTYPCIVAHLDQVQDVYPKDMKIIETDDIIFSWSNSKRSQCGLGADDKCGIYIALEMLRRTDAIKVALFHSEEIGCVGSSDADMRFFDNVRFVVEPDRRGYNDLIVSIGHTTLCSDEFLSAIGYEQFGYKQTNGLMTDVDELKQNGLPVSAINLSCGYYDPHTENEFVVKRDLLNALAFVEHIVNNCTDVYTHTPKWESPLYGNRTYYDWYDDWDSPSESKNKGAYDAESLEEWYEQYNAAYEDITAWLDYGNEMTEDEFIQWYGSTYPLLSESDVRDLFADIRYERRNN